MYTVLAALYTNYHKKMEVLMKGKRLFGRLALAFAICAVLVFNFFVFPEILASATDDSVIKTIAFETALPDEPDEPETSPAVNANEQPWDRETLPVADLLEALREDETLPDINAISKEQAIEITEGIWPVGIGVDNYKWAIQTTTGAITHARYLENTDPMGDPSWFCLYEQRVFGEQHHYIPEDLTPEEFIYVDVKSDYRLGEDREGTPVIVVYSDWSQYLVAEINAITGECVDTRLIGGRCTGADGGDVLDAFYGDGFRQFFESVNTQTEGLEQAPPALY